MPDTADRTAALAPADAAADAAVADPAAPGAVTGPSPVGGRTDDELRALAARIDLPIKVELLTGASMFTLHGVEEVGLAPMAFSDGPTGVRGLKFTGGERVALFPSATVLSSSWNADTFREVGVMLAEEAERQHIHVVLGPTINLHRSALGGRLFEQYSEDPLLTGHLAAAYVRGLQGKGIGACLKHLVANESETLRNYMSSSVDEATLREVYLLPFEIAIEEAHPWSIMAAYNDVNGTPATENVHLNLEILKGEWGWDGLLMSDWFATKTSAPAANGGLDLVMPGPMGPWADGLLADVESGAVAESVIDDKVCRLLRLAERVGALGGERDWPTEALAADAPQRRGQLRRIATDGLVVLKNDAGVLPLAAAGSIALVGRAAVATVCMGGGSAQVNPPHQVSIAEGLTAQAGDRVTVVDGVEVRDKPVLADPAYLSDPETGSPGVRIRVLDADGVVMSDEVSATAGLNIGIDDDLPRPVERVVLSGRITSGGPVVVGAIGTGEWTIRVDGSEVGSDRLAAGGVDPGESILIPPTHALDAEAVDGSVVEAEVRVIRTEPVPGPDGHIGYAARLVSQGSGLKGLVARPAPRPVADVIADAVAAAQAADVAVVAVGLSEQRETEAQDKSTLALPGAQDELVSAVAAAAQRTVVVVNASTPVLMPWAGEVDAILVIGLPGQEGGHAVADALLGVREPAGRLVTTWPAADGAAPAWDVVPGGEDGMQLPYDDGAFIGHRGWFAGRAGAPAHWFGEGLGYGSWDYLGAEVVGDAGAPAPDLAVTIRNLSERESREVVQVYWRPDADDQPVRLVGFGAAVVPAGGESVVEVTTDARMWRHWDEAAGAWTQLPVAGELLVARGLGDIRARISLG